MIKYRSPWRISISYIPASRPSSLFRSLRMAARCCVSCLHHVSYIFNRHHMRRVPDFWSVTASPLKKLTCQATMSSVGWGVAVQ